MIDLVPDNQTAYTNLGAALYMLGDYAGATGAWRRNVDLSPSKTAYSNLGLAEYYAGTMSPLLRCSGGDPAGAGRPDCPWLSGERIGRATRPGGGESVQLRAGH